MCVLFKPSTLKIQRLRNKNKARKQHRKQRADDLRIGCRENKFSPAAEDKTMTHNGQVGGHSYEEADGESTREDLNLKGTMEDDGILTHAAKPYHYFLIMICEINICLKIAKISCISRCCGAILENVLLCVICLSRKNTYKISYKKNHK